MGKDAVSTKSRKTTPRQIRAIQNRVNGMTKEQSLLEAGYSESTARTQAADVFHRMDPELREAFARAGLTLDHIAKTIHSLTTDSNGSVRAAGVKSWKELTGVEPAKRHEHSGSIDLSVEDARRHQNRLMEQFGEWLH